MSLELKESMNLSSTAYQLYDFGQIAWVCEAQLFQLQNGDVHYRLGVRIKRDNGCEVLRVELGTL